MNKTITNLVETTANDNVLGFSAKLMAWGNKKVKVSFTKKDGSIRNMVCVPNNSWNAMNGIDTITSGGLKMLKTKLARGIITVSEILENGSFVPRSINLNKVISMELV